MPAMLLRGGTVLVHDALDQVSAVQADVLIEGDIISKVAPGIPAPQGTEIVDCTDKIISPGFVDTHTHMWETPLKGSCENLPALSYFATSRPEKTHRPEKKSEN